MQHENALEGLLRLQLSSDAISALYLPSVLSTLSPAQFSTSTDSQIHKWATRITSLLQSKDSGARWAGIYLAKKTGELRRDLAVEYAQRWINLTLPLLSKSEPPPVWKAAIDLLTFLFVSTTHLSEFRRQVSTPIVPKLSAALLELLEKGDIHLKNIILVSLAQLVSNFPSLHRALTPQIAASALSSLAGSFPPVFPHKTIQAAAHLLATLHQTDGKVGAPLAWRNTLESAMFEAWKSIGHLQGNNDLRLSFTPKKPFELPQLPGDPLPAIQISLQRLSNMITVIEAVFRVNPSRPVLVPVADLTTLALHLLQSNEAGLSTKQDPTLLQLEKQVVPLLVRTGCDLTTILATSLHATLTPHATSLISCFAYHLEQASSASQRNHLLFSLVTLLNHTTSHTPTLPSRLFRVVVPLLSPLMAEKRAIDSIDGAIAKDDQGGKKSKGKSRARAFEGEEVLNGSETKFSGPDEIEVILHSLDVLQHVLRMAYLPASLHSIGTRLILGLHAHLLTRPPVLPIESFNSGISTPFSRLISKLITLQSELSLGTAGYSSRGLPLTISMLSQSGEDALVENATGDNLRAMDILIHPRMPPSPRPLPHAESLMLWRKEESKEEKEDRTGLALIGDKEDLEVEDKEIEMRYEERQDEDTHMRTQDAGPISMFRAMELEQYSLMDRALQPAPATPLQQQPQETNVTILPNSFGTFGANLQSLEPDKDTVATPPVSLGGPIPSYVQPIPSTPIVVVGSTQFLEEAPRSENLPAAGKEDDSDEDIPSIDMDSDSE